MDSVYLGLGSNLGDRLLNLQTATKELLGYAHLKSSSSIWETSPWGLGGQPFFLNCVLLVDTSLSPFDLFQKFHSIELDLGRVRWSAPLAGAKSVSTDLRFGPRVIDIDILFYGSQIIGTPELVIPHPLLHLRKFVLLPLSELAPDFIHPVLNKSVLELLSMHELNSCLHSKERCTLFLGCDEFLSFLDLTSK